jgi:hypothetical protein
MGKISTLSERHRIFGFFSQIVRDYYLPISLTLSLRLGLSLWMATVWGLVDGYRPQPQDLVTKTFGVLAWRSSLLGRMLSDVWMRWDAVHYLNIAKVGYEGVGVGDLNYFPLYPYAIRALSFILFKDVTLAGLVLSTFSICFALIFLQKLTADTFEDECLARSAVWIYAIYPASVFFFAPYTEALFVCLAIFCFWALRNDHWIIAGIAGALAVLTRAQGLFLLLPFAVILWKQGKLRDLRQAVVPLLSSIMIPLGWLSFILWRRYRDVPNLISTLEGYSNIVFADPVRGILRAFGQAFETGSLLVYSELFSLLTFTFILIWMIIQNRFRREADLILYSGATLLLFLTKQSTAASVYQSSNRYVLSLFPIFIGLAYLVNKLPKKGRKLYIAVNLVGLLIVSALYALFIFVG